MNKSYTDSWIVDFTDEKLAAYRAKFCGRFEKHIKHHQQIDFVRQYLRQDMKWMDAPIGSGRLMEQLKCREMVGFDKSPVFVRDSRAKGIETIQGDLFDMPFVDSFDLVTCLHTLFAFDDFRDILRGLVTSLRTGGILIADIVNQLHIEVSADKCGEYPYKSGMTREEIIQFFESLNCEVLEIAPHDIIDNRFAASFFKGNGITRPLARALYRLANILYFGFHLRPLLDRLSHNRSEKYYAKYLVGVRKK